MSTDKEGERPRPRQQHNHEASIALGAAGIVARLPSMMAPASIPTAVELPTRATCALDRFHSASGGEEQRHQRHVHSLGKVDGGGEDDALPLGPSEPGVVNDLLEVTPRRDLSTFGWRGTGAVSCRRSRRPVAAPGGPLALSAVFRWALHRQVATILCPFTGVVAFLTLFLPFMNPSTFTYLIYGRV